MGTSVTSGDVAVVRFPFSDLSQQKRRPALVLASAEFDNVILCQITSRPYASKRALILDEDDFKRGKLPTTSYIRPDKIFTAERTLILEKAGAISQNKHNEVKRSLANIFGI